MSFVVCPRNPKPLLEGIQRQRIDERHIYIDAIEAEMARNIPGTICVEGRDFVYVEFSDPDAFRKAFPEIARSGVADRPTDGALMYDEVMITTPGGASFHALTYNRDLARWRALVVEWCRRKGLRWGGIERDAFALSTGERFPLSQCKVEFLAAR